MGVVVGRRLGLLHLTHLPPRKVSSTSGTHIKLGASNKIRMLCSSLGPVIVKAGSHTYNLKQYRTSYVFKRKTE